MSKSGKIKTRNAFLFAALLLFLIPGICAIYSGVRRAIEKSGESERMSPEISFSEEYPFSEEYLFPDTAAGEAQTNENSRFGKYLTFANKLTAYIDDYSGKSNILSPFFFAVYGKTASVLEKNLIDDRENPVIRLENGYLTYTYLYAKNVPSYTGIADFHQWLEKKNIPLLTVIPADKSDSRHAVYPLGFPEKFAETEKEFLHSYLCFLEANGISYLDTEETLVSGNEDFYAWFYRTDHHWNARAGFFVARAIAEKLQTEFGLSADASVLDRTRFHTVTYENIFLGSQGKKVTRGYISPENFDVVYPLFDTSFSLAIPTKGIDRTDTFANTLTNADALQTGEYYTDNAYETFLHGDAPLVRIHNQNCENGTRALVIKTSEANVVDTYLAFTVEYLDVIDPRHFDGSIRTFIEKTGPDAVVICSYPSDVLDYQLRGIRQEVKGSL